MILAMLMLLTNSYVTLANENTEFYAYTTNTEEFNEYAISVFGDHIYCYYNRTDLPLELGNGIYVYGDVSVPTVVNPVWNNNIVGTFKVSYSNETFSASYSEGGASELNSAKNYSTYENPLRLIKYEDRLLYAFGDTVYNMESRNTVTKQ